MAYLPKSSYTIKQSTRVGELLYIDNRSPYIGNYIETRDGKYYAGVSPTKLGIELVKPEKSDLPFGKTRNVKMFNILNQTKYNKLKKYQRVIPTKTFPKPKDYDKGEMERFFCQKSNDPKTIMEIDKETYDSLTSNKDHDANLYQAGALNWSLRGNVRQTNKTTLDIIRSVVPYIHQCFPMLHEFEDVDTSGQLFTTGGELYYERGRDYTGMYHVHDGIPMVGAEHTEEPHDTLVWAKNLQSPNELKGFEDFNYKNFLNEKEREKNRKRKKQLLSNAQAPISIMDVQTNRSSGGRSTGGGLSSGGGGGGY